MTTPTKPAVSGSAQAVEWNQHVASQVADKAAAATTILNELVNLQKEFVTGGSSIEWEVAWAHIRFVESALRAWQLNHEVSERTVRERWAPPIKPLPLQPLPSPEQEPEQ